MTHSADLLIEGPLHASQTFVKIEKLSLTPATLADLNADPRKKVFLLGFPCEAGHKNLTDGRLGA